MTFRTTFIAALLAVALPVASSAATVLNSYENGWVMQSGASSDGNTNTITGYYSGNEYRSYYIFDVSAFAGEVVNAATLTFRGGNGYSYTNGNTTTTTIFDVDQRRLAALDRAVSGTPGFADLGTGTAYGSFTLYKTGNNRMTEISVRLNAAGLSNLNAAIAAGETEFGFGAKVTARNGSLSYVWAGSGGTSAARLSVESSPTPVPLPASALLLGLGLAGLGAMRFSKKA